MSSPPTELGVVRSVLVVVAGDSATDTARRGSLVAGIGTGSTTATVGAGSVVGTVGRSRGIVWGVACVDCCGVVWSDEAVGSPMASVPLSAARPSAEASTPGGLFIRDVPERPLGGSGEP